jgi:hypothetical protein
MDRSEKDKITSGQLLHLQVFSTSVFIISYLLVFIVSGLAFLYISSDLDVPASLILGKTQVIMAESSRFWTSDSIISIYTTVPVTCFIIGVFSLFAFHLNTRPSFTFLTGTVWTFIHAFNLSLGAIAIDLFSHTGFSKAAREMGIETVMTVLIIGVSLFFMYKLGIFAARIFHDRLFKGFTNDKNTASQLFIRFLLLPWFVGTLLLLLLSFPEKDYKNYLLPLSSLILILPTFFYEPKVTKQKPSLKKLEPKHLILVMSFSIVALVVYFFVLRTGISF